MDDKSSKANTEVTTEEPKVVSKKKKLFLH